MRTLASAIVALALAGCPSLSTRQTANTLPPGDWQIGGAFDLYGFRDVEQDARIPAAQLELSARRGLAADLDAGLKLFVAGLEAGAKWRFRRGPWPLALSPSASVSRTTTTPLTTDALHLLVQLPLLVTHGNWTFGPKLFWALYWPVTGGHADGWSLGAHVSYDIRFRHRWHLQPELSLYRSLAGDVPVDGGSAQLGLGLARDF